MSTANGSLGATQGGEDGGGDDQEEEPRRRQAPLEAPEPAERPPEVGRRARRQAPRVGRRAAGRLDDRAFTSSPGCADR